MPARRPVAVSQFVASINWGDVDIRVTVATVSGAAGSFVVSGRHKYAKNGHYALTVTIAVRSNDFRPSQWVRQWLS